MLFRVRVAGHGAPASPSGATKGGRYPASSSFGEYGLTPGKFSLPCNVLVLPDGELVYPDLLLKAGGAGSPLFFGEECYGFGDATLAAARLLGLLSRHPGPAADFFAHADL